MLHCWVTLLSIRYTVVTPNHPLHALLPLPKNMDENCNYEHRDKTEDFLLYQDPRFCGTKKTENFFLPF